MSRHFFSIIFIVLFSATEVAIAWDGQVVNIFDADTVEILQDRRQVKVRLYGIDAPEKGQAYGRKAAEFVAGMVIGVTVDVETIASNGYGQEVCIVKAAGQNINLALVKSGLAWVYPKECRRIECREWISQENMVKDKRIGLWADLAPEAPWKWRRARRFKGSSAKK